MTIAVVLAPFAPSAGASAGTTGGISGFVRDMGTGKPEAGAKVTIISPMGMENTVDDLTSMRSEPVYPQARSMSNPASCYAFMINKLAPLGGSPDTIRGVLEATPVVNSAALYDRFSC